MELKYENLDDDGITNLMVAIVESARKDYVSGYGKIMSRFDRILTEEEFNDWFVLSQSVVDNFIRDCRNFYSAIKFVKEDPYNLFVGKEDHILDTWKALAEETYATRKKLVETA